MTSIGKDYALGGHDPRELLYFSSGYLSAQGTPRFSVIQSNALSSQQKSDDQRRLVEAGQQFESYFISYLLKVMRDTVPQGAIADKQGAYFYSMYDEEIGRRAAETGGIGITKMVEDYAKTHMSTRTVQHSSSSQ